MTKQSMPFNRIKGNIFSIPLSSIRPNPYQVRVVLDEEYVASLAENIRENEMVQIPQGTLLPNGKVQLIFGHNRLAAHKLLARKDAKYKFMPIEIVAEVSDETMFTRAIAENVHDELKVSDQIHIIETAKKFNYTSEAIGEKLLNMSGAAVRSLWRLKNLPPEILSLVDDGQISQVVARRILSAAQFLGDPETVTRRILSLPNMTEANIQEAILQAFKDAGGVQTLNLSDGTTDKMSADWDPGEFEPREWNQVSAAFPFRELDKETFTRLLSDDPNPQGRYEQLALEMVTHMRAPGPCKSCPFSISLYKITYCSISACYRMKQDRLADKTFAHLSQELGIHPYREDDGPYREVEAPFYEASKEVTKALKKKSRDLRLVREANLAYTHYYTNSHWAKLVWVGRKAEQPIAAPQDAISERRQSDENSTGPDINGLIDYATPILSTWLKDHDDFMTVALALLKIPITQRTDNVRLSVARRIITTVLDQYDGAATPEYLAELAAKFEIPLPKDWEKKTTSFGFSKSRKSKSAR